MKRDVRGFLLGLLVAALWLALTAGIGGSEGRYRLKTLGHDSAFVLDTETARLYYANKRGTWLDLGSPSTREVTVMPKR